MKYKVRAKVDRPKAPKLNWWRNDDIQDYDLMPENIKHEEMVKEFFKSKGLNNEGKSSSGNKTSNRRGKRRRRVHSVRRKSK